MTKKIDRDRNAPHGRVHDAVTSLAIGRAANNGNVLSGSFDGASAEVARATLYVPKADLRRRWEAATRIAAKLDLGDVHPTAVVDPLPLYMHPDYDLVPPAYESLLNMGQVA